MPTVAKRGRKSKVLGPVEVLSVDGRLVFAELTFERYKAGLVRWNIDLPPTKSLSDTFEANRMFREAQRDEAVTRLEIARERYG